MANSFLVDTPELAHKLAGAMGTDAANKQMRKAGRSKWNLDDRNLAAITMQRWYKNFNILNSHAWMPEGYEWQEQADGEYLPARKVRREVAA